MAIGILMARLFLNQDSAVSVMLPALQEPATHLPPYPHSLPSTKLVASTMQSALPVGSTHAILQSIVAPAGQAFVSASDAPCALHCSSRLVHMPAAHLRPIPEGPQPLPFSANLSSGQWTSFPEQRSSSSHSAFADGLHTC